MSEPRKLMVIRGQPTRTAEVAAACVAPLPASEVIWVSETASPLGLETTDPSRTRNVLGRSCSAAVMDLHGAVHAEAIGRIEGTVRGGGALVLRLDAPDAQPVDRFARRFRRVLARATHTPVGRLSIVAAPTTGTPEQAEVVRRIERFFGGPPGQAVLTADRGRGKSAALGLALATLGSEVRAIVCGPSRSACAEVFQFAARDDLAFLTADEATRSPAADVVVVDEAAQIPVPVLRRLTEVHPGARIVFATTVHGYEGTGRGFALRFLSGLRTRGSLLLEATLSEPIRWAVGDPVESFVRDALLLDADPDPSPIAFDSDEVSCARLDRQALADDDGLLRSVFGLLVQAHYRTTPADLHRMLDAPNVHVHVARVRGAVVGATIVAEEGALPEPTIDDLDRGRGSIRGHALAETFVSHLGHREGGRLKLVRSVRIATHPMARRRGVAARLVSHVHESYEPDLFGTIHGVTPELLRFRRSVGYEVVRVGASRGSRTGEPSVTMVRPRTSAGRAFYDVLREDLARDLPTQLALFASGDSLLLQPDLASDLRSELRPPREEAWRAARVAAYAYGPRTFESVAVDVIAYVRDHAHATSALGASSQALIESRVLAGHSWRRTADAAELDSLPAAMKGLRRAVRELAERMGDVPRPVDDLS